MHESLGGLPVLLSDSYESELKLALVQVECFPCIIVGNHTFLLQSRTEKMSQHSRVLLKILKKKAPNPRQQKKTFKSNISMDLKVQQSWVPWVIHHDPSFRGDENHPAVTGTRIWSNYAAAFRTRPTSLVVAPSGPRCWKRYTEHIVQAAGCSWKSPRISNFQ